jgi:hypothetical protein
MLPDVGPQIVTAVLMTIVFLSTQQQLLCNRSILQPSLQFHFSIESIALKHLKIKKAIPSGVEGFKIPLCQ